MRSVAMTSSTKGTRPVHPTAPAEATEVHTRILRLALAVEDSRAYWSHVDPISLLARPPSAHSPFEQRWFGAKTSAYSLPARRLRGSLRRLPGRARRSSAVADDGRGRPPGRLPLAPPALRPDLPPLHRATSWSSGAGSANPKVDRDIVLRWVKREFPDRWGEATCVQFASKLLSAASEAGLISPKRDPRALLLPKVPDIALAYLLHLLRGVSFAGTLTENPYLASVGWLDGARFLGPASASSHRYLGIGFHRMAKLTDFEWAAPTLAAWAEAAL